LIVRLVVPNPVCRGEAVRLRWIQLLSTLTPRSSVSRRVKAPAKVLSTALPPAVGCLRVEKLGRTSSSATAGSSNVSVPGKYRLPAIPWRRHDQRRHRQKDSLCDHWPLLLLPSYSAREDAPPPRSAGLKRGDRRSLVSTA
jgi:hypothetical protein